MSLSQQRKAFTLIELLIATTIFVSLMGMISVAFSRISNGGKKGLQVLELHGKADAIMRHMEEDLRCIPNVAAMHLQPATLSDPGTLTFMKQVTDTHPAFTNRADIAADYNHFESTDGQHFRLTDLIWVRWEWGSGYFNRGQSRINQAVDSMRQWRYQHINMRRKVSHAGAYVRYLDLDLSNPLGVQQNAVPPMLQRHFNFFEGTGSVNSIDSTTGASAADAGQKIQVYQIVGGNYFYKNKSEYFDVDGSPWRNPTQDMQGGDLRHLYTTLDLGNSDPLSDPDAYAVRNMDGVSVNKDRLNLLGAEDTDADGQHIYPNQMNELFDGVEYMQIELVGRNGQVIGAGDESDRLNDGAASIDISGVEPLTGDGIAERPIQVRISYMLHSIPGDELDETDYDVDGDTDELLMRAVADVVTSEGHATQLERIESYRKHALRLGYVASYFNQTVQLGY